MNIQLMNVAVDIIEQRLAPLANVLTRNNHITAMRDSFALAMPFVIVGSLLVPILFPPVSIDGASRFGQVYLLLRPILLPTFQLTIGLVALIVAFGASASLAKQYRLPERLCGLTGCLAFLLFIGFRETAVSNVYLGGMGIFTALISSTYSIELIRFFYKKGWCIRLPDEVPLMTRNGFQLLIPLLVVMLSISVMNAILLQTTGRIVPELISEAVRPLVLASDTLMAVLISLFICNLLWFIGIHGALIITGIMNPVFLLPFLFVPLINACIAWYLTQLGILDRAVAMLPWSMPSPLGAAWSANGSWKNLCMSLFAMFNAWMLYRPFFKVYERQLAETER
ncbi:TPA: PTS sugar transporter subunit IIC [Klebsiella pneumoniae]